MSLWQLTKDANSGDAWGGSLSGAAKGASVGGIPGAVIGGIIGGVGGLFKHISKRKAANAADEAAQKARDVAQQAMNRRRTALSALAKALGREGYFGDVTQDPGSSHSVGPEGTPVGPAPGAAYSFGNPDDWTLPGITKVDRGSWFGDFMPGLDSAAGDVGSMYLGNKAAGRGGFSNFMSPPKTTKSSGFSYSPFSSGGTGAGFEWAD